METVISIIQIILSVLLMASILLQHSNAGLGATFGGGGSVQSTKRGLDKVLFNTTIVFATLFFLVAIVSLLIQ
jgi:preprotein translocase subunit SecG